MSISGSSLSFFPEVLQSLVAEIDGIDLGKVAEIFFVQQSLQDNKVLGRKVCDQNYDIALQQKLLVNIFGDHISLDVMRVLGKLLEYSKINGCNFTYLLESSGVCAAVIFATSSGADKYLITQLLQCSSFIAGNSELNYALNSKFASKSSLLKLISELFSEIISPVALLLISQVAFGRYGSNNVSGRLKSFINLAVSMRGSVLAYVKVAKQLDGEQVSRLRESISKIYSSEVILDLNVVPELLGGFKVQVADEVIDMTLVTKFKNMRRSFAV